MCRIYKLEDGRAALTAVWLIAVLTCVASAQAGGKQPDALTHKKSPEEQALDLENKSWDLARAGKYVEAIALGSQALSILAKVDSTPSVANRIKELHRDLAYTYYLATDFRQAEQHISAVLPAGQRNQTYIEPMDFILLALIYQAQGKVQEASASLAQAVKLRNTWSSSLGFTEQDKMQSLLYTASEADLTISFHRNFAPNNPVIARLALLAVLARKGSVVDSMSQFYKWIRASDRQELIALLRDYVSARGDLASLRYKRNISASTPEYIAAVQKYNTAMERFKNGLQGLNRGGTGGGLPAELSVENVQAALPPDSALIEFVAYRPFIEQAGGKGSRFLPLKYLAYILRRDGPPQAVNLPDAAQIDADINDFLSALRDSSSVDVKDQGRHLDQELMLPIRQAATGIHTLFIAPDGQLNLLPFAALVDEHDQYLVENYSLRYLSSGRDLLALQPHPIKNGQSIPTGEFPLQSRQGPILIGDPDFDDDGADNDFESISGTIAPAEVAILPLSNVACPQYPLLAALENRANASTVAAGSDKSQASANRQPPQANRPPAGRGRAQSPVNRISRDTGSENFDEINFPPTIEYTRQEVLHICSYLPGAMIYVGSSATEALLNHLAGPTVLHIATHGFFLSDQAGRPEIPKKDDPWSRLRFPATSTWTYPEVTDPLQIEGPLLRSGLGLAGGNKRRSMGGKDGILTALEAANLDLGGTQLVVLSACNTGVGDVKNAEGVFGLRRALAVAGAESMVTTLWPVEDRSTNSLMVEYYKRLWWGEGRAGALREVQIEMLHGNDEAKRHPYFWAGFIQSGAWTSLDLEVPDQQ